MTSYPPSTLANPLLNQLLDSSLPFPVSSTSSTFTLPTVAATSSFPISSSSASSTVVSVIRLFHYHPFLLSSILQLQIHLPQLHFQCFLLFRLQFHRSSLLSSSIPKMLLPLLHISNNIQPSAN